MDTSVSGVENRRIAQGAEGTLQRGDIVGQCCLGASVIVFEDEHVRAAESLILCDGHVQEVAHVDFVICCI